MFFCHEPSKSLGLWDEASIPSGNETWPGNANIDFDDFPRNLGDFPADFPAM